jgi:hypothetical protein
MTASPAGGVVETVSGTATFGISALLGFVCLRIRYAIGITSHAYIEGGVPNSSFGNIVVLSDLVAQHDFGL